MHIACTHNMFSCSVCHSACDWTTKFCGGSNSLSEYLIGAQGVEDSSTHPSSSVSHSCLLCVIVVNR
jgi:hypothetical protein